MFQFRRFPTYAYFIQRMLHGYCPCGLPHSEIHGSRDICSSPWLIAAYHVLLRLLMPRHSPCALFSLTNRKQHSLFSLWIMQASQRFFEIVIVTHLYDVPQLNIHFASISESNSLSVALLHFVCHIVQFSRCNLFQPLLKSDWNTQFLECFNLISMVEISGIEPLTSCLQGRRSPSWAKPPNILY